MIVFLLLNTWKEMSNCKLLLLCYYEVLNCSPTVRYAVVDTDSIASYTVVS